LIRQLRFYLHEVCAAAGIPTSVVPHQLRHYAEFRAMPSKLAGPLIYGCFSRQDSA